MLYVFVFLVGLAAGAYGWYRFGAKLAADADIIKPDVKKL